MILHECSIDESQQGSASDGPPESLSKAGDRMASCYDSLARAVIDMRENIPLGWYPHIMKRDFGYKYLSMIAYACEVKSRRKRTAMDVDKMVAAWIPLIRQLATAHDVDEKDAASAGLDDLLMPVVGSPVAQIRDFYRKLTTALKEDKTIPWCVWRMFDFWGTNVLDKITTEQELQLKKEIANKIAELSMEQIPREDWISSMVGALMWRNPETLQVVEAEIKSGHKPRVKGRESCLFLQVNGKEVML